MTEPTAPSRPAINWVTTTMFTLTMLGAVTLVPWWGYAHGYGLAAWAGFLFFLCANGLAITSGYHRLWAHRTYEAHWSLRVIYLVFGTMALQNSVLVWATDHRRHHRYVDDGDRDPYSASRGFWYSHIGWMLRHWPTGRMDFSNGRDLEQDPMLRFQHRFYLPLALATNIGLPVALGWLAGDIVGVFLVAGLLRLVVNHHATFCINSLAHMWGTQPYTDQNSARDNPLLAFITYGEGYHNFHHIFERDYRNAVRWWQWDPAKWLISAMSWLGLARKLQRVPDVVIERARIAMQFRRAEAALDRCSSDRRLPDFEAMRERVGREFEAFQATLAEWSKLREEWYAGTRQRMVQRWEELSFRTQVREIEYRLRMQRRRMSLLTAQLLTPQLAST